MSGLFVAFDGPGGAGKSTTVRLLRERLSEEGLPVVATTEPSHSALGCFTRAHTGDYRGLSLACLVAADRYHHLDTEIRPALAAEQLVLCDRYLASSLVLQAGIDGVPPEFVRALNTHVDLPDLNVIMTAPPDVLRERLTTRGSHGRFEDDPANTDREFVLYQEVLAMLEGIGVPTLVIDTGSDVGTTVSRLAATIQALWSHRHL